MSAIELSPVSGDRGPRSARIRLVGPGEASAARSRRERARAAIRARQLASAVLVAKLGSIGLVFLGSVATMAWAFLSVPDLPLP